MAIIFRRIHGARWRHFVVIATVRDVTALRHSTVDMAISRIDLANAHTRIDGLQNSLDLVVQRLFALGTWLSAAAASETALTDRLGTSVQRINDVIEAVQERRPARGR